MDFNKYPPIIVYQMGKVGSSAVYESLKMAGFKGAVFHVHFLSHENLTNMEAYHRKAGDWGSVHLMSYWRSIRFKLDRSRQPVNLISLVRDPVAREVSDVFQNMAIYHKELLTSTGDVDIDKTVDFLLTRFKYFDESIDYACTWFDIELENCFGLDIYSAPFDHERGYSVLENEKARLLLFRLEDLSMVFSDALQSFLGRAVPLAKSNETSAKQYHEAYKSVLRKIILPTTTGEKIYNSRYAKHFYPKPGRAEFSRKWSSSNMHGSSK